MPRTGGCHSKPGRHGDARGRGGSPRGPMGPCHPCPPHCSLYAACSLSPLPLPPAMLPAALPGGHSEYGPGRGSAGEPRAHGSRAGAQSPSWSCHHAAWPCSREAPIGSRPKRNSPDQGGRGPPLPASTGGSACRHQAKGPETSGKSEKHTQMGCSLVFLLPHTHAHTRARGHTRTVWFLSPEDEGCALGKPRPAGRGGTTRAPLWPSTEQGGGRP